MNTVCCCCLLPAGLVVSVGMKDIPKESGNEANVRSTTPFVNKPVTRNGKPVTTRNGKLTSKETYTYAEVVRRRPTPGRVSFESEREKSSLLTLKKYISSV
jgi:hypothetical protein